MSKIYQKDYEQDELLNLVKRQNSNGPARPRLYQVLEQGGAPLPLPAYEWMYSIGGSSTMYAAGEKSVRTAQELIKAGRLVPTFTEYYYDDNKTLRLLQHFDDVRFGYSEEDELIIFKLSDNDVFPDRLIMPDPQCDAAIAELKKRFQNERAVIDEPIVLHHRDAPQIIRPVISDPELAEIRKRQRCFIPG